MRVIFMGTPQFAIPSLELLAHNHEVVLVVTRPDAVRSRGRKKIPSPVAAVAEALAIPTVKTVSIDEALVAHMEELAPDVICVVAFGCIIPDKVLHLARYGCINVHGSLLPRWRGAAPIQRAILAGDTRVGVSIMRVVSELDGGAWCRQASIEVADSNCDELLDHLAVLGAEELTCALTQLESGTCDWIEQNANLVTYAAKVDKAELLLNPAESVRTNLLRVQASLDTSPARMCLAGRSVRVLRARPGDVMLVPGEVSRDKRRLQIGCSDGALEIITLKPDGKREMSAASFVLGMKDAAPIWECLA